MRSRGTEDVYLTTTKMAAEDLPAKVKDLLTNRLDKTVFLKADSRARYEKVVDVVDNLRAAGVDQLGLLTEQIQGEKPKTPTATQAPAGSKREVFLKEQSLWQWQSADRQRSEIRHQHDAHDRRAAGADHHLHGDHALDAARGWRRSCLSRHRRVQKADQSDQRTVVISIDKDHTMMINQEADRRAGAWAPAGGDLQDARRARGLREGRSRPRVPVVAKAIDIAHGAGIDKVGLMTAKVEAGQ